MMKRPLTITVFALGIIALIFIAAQHAMGGLPIGFDVTTSYLAQLTQPQTDSFFDYIRTFNFLYFLIRGVKSLFNVDALVLLKVLGALIPTFFSASFALLAHKLLKPKWWILGVGIILFTLQPATLRFSWDLYRNTFALSWAMIALWLYLNFREKRSVVALLGCAVSIILAMISHQMVAYMVVLSIILCALYFLSTKYIKAPWFPWVFGIILLGVYLPLCIHIHAGNFYLRVPSHQNPQLATSLFWLLFTPIIPLVILGLKRFHKPLFILITLILFAHALSPVFLPNNPFFLWDRWMYFLTVPFSLLGIAGLIELSELNGIKRLQQILLVVLCSIFGIFAGIRFLLPKSTFPLGSAGPPPEIVNFMPPTFLWDAIGREQASDVAEAAHILRNNYNGSTSIYTSDQYLGLIWYYLPDIASKITVQPAMVPAWSAPEAHYLLFGINYARLAPGEPLPGSNQHQPVQRYDEGQP